MYILHNLLDCMYFNLNLDNRSDNKKNILLLGDGFFARGFLHTINYNKFNITQIYRDDFINPQDMFYSLNNNKYTHSNLQSPLHLRDYITNYFMKKSIKKIKLDIKNLNIISNSIAEINNNKFYFDYMVIGLGAQKSLKSWYDELYMLKQEKHKTIDIIGSGPLGFEIAMCLNKNHKINLYDVLNKDKILFYVKEYNKNFLLNLLNKKNIDLYLGKFYNQNDPMNKDNYKIFCVGTKPNDLTENFKINDKLELINTENKNIYVGGDCVALQNNSQYIKTAQVAYQQGVYVARKLNRENRENREISEIPFEYKSNGLALNIDDKQVLIEKHNIVPDGIYPDFIMKLYSVFCI